MMIKEQVNNRGWWVGSCYVCKCVCRCNVTREESSNIMDDYKNYRVEKQAVKEGELFSLVCCVGCVRVYTPM